MENSVSIIFSLPSDFQTRGSGNDDRQKYTDLCVMIKLFSIKLCSSSFLTCVKHLFMMLNVYWIEKKN